MKIVSVLFFLLLTAWSWSQDGRKITRREYIETYKELAMREMESTGIPASIKLAQGILESGDGNSTLARRGNNHFGIKCHDWKGKTIHHNDDENNECFRKYKSVEESYRDHSEFLTTRKRYSELFELNPNDYKAWARGLKKSGYATSPTYAEALIRIIEENKLYEYDRQVMAGPGAKHKGKPVFTGTEYAGGRKANHNNRVKYVLAREGDSFSSLSEELDLFQWQLPKYNDLPVTTIFSEGEKVYLQPKRNKAEVGKNTHIAGAEETLHSISQRYAIKLDKLAWRNQLTPDAVLKSGQEIYLRGKAEGTRKQISVPKIELRDEGTTEEFIIEFDIDR